MAAKITVSASDVWGYFQDKKENLKSYMHQIASNPEYGVAIFVTEDSGLPSIVVTADNVQVYEETTVNEHDCEKTVDKIYDDYLTSKVINSLVDNDDGESDDLTALEIEDMIDERENELDAAVYEFLMTVVQDAYIDDYTSDFDDIVEDLKEHFLEYIARKHGLPVYRPMMLEYEDGTEEMSEYPYEDMEFDDPDNPLYKA